MDIFWRIAEEKIQQAYRNGEFDDIDGMGKPLRLDDLSGIPEDLRMAYRILKNAGYTEEEMAIKKDIMTIEDLLKRCTDEEEQKLLEKDLSEKLLRYNSLLAKRRVKTNSSVFKNYQEKIEKQLL